MKIATEQSAEWFEKIHPPGSAGKYQGSREIVSSRMYREMEGRK